MVKSQQTNFPRRSSMADIKDVVKEQRKNSMIKSAFTVLFVLGGEVVSLDLSLHHAKVSTTAAIITIAIAALYLGLVAWLARKLVL